MPVKRENLVFSVSGTGLLEAEKAVEVKPPQIEEVYRFKIVSMIEEGKSVKAGDPILSFDPSEIMKRMTDERASLDKVKEELEKTHASLDLQGKDLELQLEEAKVQKEKAENKLTEAREFQSNIKVKEAEYEAQLGRKKVEFLQRKLAAVKINSELQLKLLEDKKTFYEKRLKRANDAIESLNVKAPISGVVIYKTNWNNEKKQVGSDVFMLESVFSIPDLATLLVNAQVAEVDAGKVKPGQSVSVTLDAIPDKTFTGQVTQVSDIFTVASSGAPGESAPTPTPARYPRSQTDEARDGGAGGNHCRPLRGCPCGARWASSSSERGNRTWSSQGAKGPERREVRLGKSNGVVAILKSGLADGEKIAGEVDVGGESRQNCGLDLVTNRHAEEVETH